MLYNISDIPKSVPTCRILKADQIRRGSVPVDLADIAKVQELIQKMIKACVVNHGVGLAAPQIGVFRKVEDFEVCLSVPGKKVKVSRSDLISASWTEINQDGTFQEMAGSRQGYEARVFLHETDHLEGITILDRSKR